MARRGIRRGSVVAAVVAALAVALGWVTPVSGQDVGAMPQAAVVTAAPTDGLVDLQRVTVSGAGFDPDEPVILEQCAVAPGVGARCRGGAATSAIPDATGSFSVGMTVRRYVFDAMVPIDCADAGACEIVWGVRGLRSPGPAIRFDPGVPPPAAPSLSVVPDRGLVDGETVTVSLSNGPPTEGADLPGRYFVVQCRADLGGAAGCQTAEVGKYNWITTDGAGSSSATYVVHRTITTGSGVVDCAVPPGCALQFGYPFGEIGDGTALRAPIEFAPTPAADPTPSRSPSPLVPSFTG